MKDTFWQKELFNKDDIKQALVANKPLIKNYLLFSLTLILFLAIFFLPKNYSYVEWAVGAEEFLSLPPLIIRTIGNIFFALSFFLPMIVLTFLIRKNLFQRANKAIFYKIPLTIFSLSLVLSLISLSIGGLYQYHGICNGEGCIGLIFLCFIAPLVWLGISFVVSFIVFLYNGTNITAPISSQTNRLTKILIILFFISIILFTFSCIGFYHTLNSGANAEQKDIIEKFPKSSKLIRTKICIDGKDKESVSICESPFKGYNHYYLQHYSTCLNMSWYNDCNKQVATIYYVYLVSFNNSKALEESLDQVGIVAKDGKIVNNKSGKKEGDNNGMSAYSMSKINLNGCEVAKFNMGNFWGGNSIIYLWINNKKNYIIEIYYSEITKTSDENGELIKSMIENFGCSLSASSEISAGSNTSINEILSQ